MARPGSRSPARQRGSADAKRSRQNTPTDETKVNATLLGHKVQISISDLGRDGKHHAAPLIENAPDVSIGKELQDVLKLSRKDFNRILRSIKNDRTNEALEKVGKYREALRLLEEDDLSRKRIEAFNILSDVKTESGLEKAIRDIVAIYGLQHMLAADFRSSADVEPDTAKIERYANRRPGEDAITFFKRAWGGSPQPLYREHVSAHDPELIAAISQRCRNLNRKLPKDQRLSLENILPPARPLTPNEERRRDQARTRQANYRAKLLGAAKITRN